VQRLPIKYAKPGMVLAKEAVTEEGMVLCGPGTELDAAIISRFQKAGLEAITVEGHPVILPGEKSLKERIKELEMRFSRVKGDPILMALMKLIAHHWVEQEMPNSVSQQKK